ncbi:MAG: hypothetical protein K5924_00730 [Chloroflexi bacterium]|nr:hypothetical protein [Chloroflexota bacterium]
MPMDGYRNLGAIGNQHVHVYENVGQVKVVLVVARRSGEDGTAQFVVDQLRACQLSEWGGDVDLGPEIVVWSHDTRDLIVADHAGPEHCRWDSARFLNLERPVREPAAGYVRDPLHVLPANALFGSYAEGVELPADATFSGYRSAKGEELWFVPEDRAAYVVSPNGVERWPRVKQALACM